MTALGLCTIHQNVAIIIVTATPTPASKIKDRLIYVLLLTTRPLLRIPTNQARGAYHQQAIDEVLTLGLGAATPMVTIGA